MDDRRTLDRLGVWWTFRDLNVAEVRADVRMGDAGVELPALDVAWKAMLPQIPLVPAH